MGTSVQGCIFYEFLKNVGERIPFLGDIKRIRVPWIVKQDRGNIWDFLLEYTHMGESDDHQVR